MHRSPNFGDVLLTQILRDHLLSLPDVEVKLLAPTQDVQTTLGMEMAGVGDFLRSDAVILGGGGFFQRMDGPRGTMKSLIKYALPLFLARLLGKRTAIIGAGAAPMPRHWLDRLLRFMIGGCRAIAVRDEVGLEYLAALLPKSSRQRLHRVSDLVFAIDDSWIAPNDQVWAREQCESLDADKVLAVHLSEPPSANDHYREIAGYLHEFAKNEKNCGFLLLEDHPSAQNGQALAQAEMQQVLGGQKVATIAYPGVQRLTALLQAVDAVLTTKLHVGLCAATMGTMPFAIAKHRKNLASFADLGIEENCCLLGETDSEQTSAIIKRFVKHDGAFNVPDDVRSRAQFALEIASKMVTPCS
jgi:polysaccharide pyruvyl transferase WcaK-like protein